MDEVIIEPQIVAEGEGGSMMQLDIVPFNDEKDQNLTEDDENNNEVKGELDLVVSEGETSNLEPYEGMEFDSEDAARVFYSAYARHVGFRIRISRYTRSRRDNSIISRLIVCSKEGFRESRGNDRVFGERKQQRQRAVTRVGCKAMLMVKKLASGKWVVSKFVKEHNHGPVPPRKLEVRLARKEEDTVEESNLVSDGGLVNEPFEGMEFDSEEDARTFYINYARQMGFRARISKYCRSRKDNSIISRQIVCSKEGFREVRVKKEETDDGRVKRPRMVTRIGCKAMIIVKKLSSGKWVLARFEKEHNHALVTSKKIPQLCQSPLSNDCIKKGPVTFMGGDGMLSNAGMVKNNADGIPSTSQESLTVLYNQLCYEAIKYAQEGAVSEEIYNVAMSALREAVEKVAAAKRNLVSVGQGINAGHGSGITKCSNDSKKAVSATELLLMQQPFKFVLIPSTALADNSKPATHSAESPIMLNISNGQGLSIPNHISVLKQLSPTSQSVKGLVGNGVTEHMGASQSSQKLDGVGPNQAKTTIGNGNKLMAGISEAEMVAFPALPVTLYMPVIGSLSESSSVPAQGSISSNACTLVTTAAEASPAATGTEPGVNNVRQSATPAKGQRPQTYTCRPNPQVHATAIAAGARVIPPHEAASLIKAIEARVRSSKSAVNSGCKQSSGNATRGLWHCNSAEGDRKAVGPTVAHEDTMKGQDQDRPKEMRLQEPVEGFKEMDVAMMDHSAVYDSAGEDHLFSDGGS